MGVLPGTKIEAIPRDAQGGADMNNEDGGFKMLKVKNSARVSGYKALLIASASVIALGAGMSAARAAPAPATDTVDQNLASQTLDGGSATAFVSGLIDQVNTANVTASVTGTVGVTQSDVVTDTGTTNTTLANELGAFATGNSITPETVFTGGSASGSAASTVTLTSLGSTTAEDGIAVSAIQLNASPFAASGNVTGSTTPPAISATVSASSAFITDTDVTSGTLTLDSNLLTAQTTLNGSSIGVSGIVPTGYTSLSTGSIITDTSSATPVITAATIAVSTAQENLNVGQDFGSTALVTDSSVKLTDTATLGAETLTLSPDVSSNTLSAIYVGNSANGNITIDEPGPAFVGSLALSNTQANFFNTAATGGFAANNVDSTVSGTIAGTGADTATLSGTLQASSNTISSSATGNQATTTSGNGNGIVIEAGENFAGPTPGSVQSNTITTDAGVTAMTGADIALFNNQQNAGAGAEGGAGSGDLTARTLGALIDTSVNVLAGTVTMADNTISAAANGNVGTNGILSGGVGSVSFSGTVAIGSVQSNADSPISAITEPDDSIGNRIISTVGVGTGGAVTGSTVTLDNNSITATAFGNQVGPIISITANSISPVNVDTGPANLMVTRNDSTGDDVTSTASGDVTINSQSQNIAGSPVSATNTSPLISIDTSGTTTPITGDTLAITGGANTAEAAVAGGTFASNSISLSGNSISSTVGVLNVQTLGPIISDTLPPNNVTATLSSPVIDILAGNSTEPVSASTLSIASNLQQAFAEGNAGNNSFSVSGNTVAPNEALTGDIGVSAPYNITAPLDLFFDNATTPTVPTVQGSYDILSDQASSALTSGTITGTSPTVLINIGDAITGMSATVGGSTLVGSTEVPTGNAIGAVALSNFISSNEGTVNATGGGATAGLSTTTFQPVASVFNLQEIGESGFVGGGPAPAVGSEASINTTTGSPIVTGVAALFEIAVGNDGAGTGDVTGSTLTISNNSAQALAEGNRADNNILNVEGNTITDASTTALTGLQTTGSLPVSSGTVTADVGFSVVNIQTVAAATTVSAAVQAPPGATSTTASGGGGALIDVSTPTSTVTGSTLSLANNQFLATAYDNNAANNTVNIAGPNGTGNADTIATSAGVQNVQYTASTGGAFAQLGIPGTPGTPFVAPTPDNYTGSVTATTSNGATGFPTALGVVTLESGQSITYTFTVGLDSHQEAAWLTAAGGVGSFTGPTTYVVTGAETTSFTLPQNTFFSNLVNELSGDDDDTYSGSLTTAVGGFTDSFGGSPGSAVSPATVAQIISVGDPISGSTLSITAPGVVSGASATSNNVGNNLNVAANTLTGASDLTAATVGATVNLTTGALSAQADFPLENSQVVNGGGPTALAAETLGIAIVTGGAISGSTLSITDNPFEAAAEGNVASNNLSLDFNATGAAGVTSVTGALLSGQEFAATGVTATANFQAYAPVAVGTTTVAITGNSNTALGVADDATNTFTVSANNAASIMGGAVATAEYEDTTSPRTISAVADFSLNNTQQVATGVIASTATTNITNFDLLDTTTTGLVTSTVDFSDNTTIAEADANRAVNTLSLGFNNANSATGALTNAQFTSAGVTVGATAGTAGTPNQVTVTLAGGAPGTAPAATGSTISITGNSNTANARGNVATNILNAEPTGSFGTQPAAGATSSFTGPINTPTVLASASYGLLNFQDNGAAVTATSAANYGMTLTSGGGTGVITGTTGVVSGNTVAANAFGNLASNTMTISALNTGGATAALTSAQINTAPVTAVATASIGTTIGSPGATGSSFTVNSNSITAHATGNSSSNAIVSH